MVAFTHVAGAEISIVTYVLEDVWLLPDISHPWEDARQMTGTFEWTYEVGDFENGLGEFVELSLPWWGEDLPPLDWTIEQSSIEITMQGSYHDLGVDVTLFLLDPLTPDQASTIDTVESKFEIQVGVVWQGHVVSGSIVPATAPCPADITGDDVIDVLDLLEVLAQWGTAGSADITGDGVVDVLDLLEVLSAWGPCD